MEPLIPLPARRRRQLVEVLEATVVDSLGLFLVAKTAHWNVKGPEFAALHALFDEVAERLRCQADTLAERAVTLGGYVGASAAEIADHSAASTGFDEELRDGLELSHELSLRLSSHASSLRRAIQLCRGSLDDPGTDHLLAETLTAVERDIWLLDSHVQGLELTSEQEDEENGYGEGEGERPLRS